ncbi:hypothetical protein SAMN05442782_9495 [Streptomyces sp. OK228]|nr:hypothetical protein SAMN05442782_9495 [Streptomyces sp. OK228]
MPQSWTTSSARCCRGHRTATRYLSRFPAKMTSRAVVVAHGGEIVIEALVLQSVRVIVHKDDLVPE